MADSAAADGIDGQWSEIMRAGTVDGQTYTPDDLDGMVREYGTRDDAAKAPVAVGMPSQKAAPVGKIDALRRVGNSLQAKFANVDPNAEYLYGRGFFPKKSVQVKRSPQGLSLQRVGLLHPTYDQYWRVDQTPSLDELMKQETGMKDHVFSQNSTRPRNGIQTFEQSMQDEGIDLSDACSSCAAIAKLKNRGYWSERLDRYGIPLIFKEVDGTPLVAQLTTMLVGLADKCDPTSTMLAERAKYFARSRGLSFGEALSQVSQAAWNPPVPASPLTPEWRKTEKDASDRAVAAGLISPELTALAWQIARSQNVTFKQAMTRACVEHPEMVAAQANLQLDRMGPPLG
jgi:hypothetical protein